MGVKWPLFQWFAALGVKGGHGRWDMKESFGGSYPQETTAKYQKAARVLFP
jgi:hypothetical protein